jgi:hypothetical protein
MTENSNKNCCKVYGCEEIARYGTVNKETGRLEKHHCKKHKQNGEIMKLPPWKDSYADTCIIYRSRGFIITINEEIWKKECTGQNFKPPFMCQNCKNPIENPSTINYLTHKGFQCPYCVEKERKQQQNGRPSNKGFTCNGSCGNKDCKQTFKKISELQTHQEARLRKYTCPLPNCPKHTEGYGRLSDMCVHFRDKHKDLCEADGSCPQYGVNPRGTMRLIKPKKYENKITDAQWYNLKESIRMNINTDISRKDRWDKEDQEYTLKINNVKIHELTEKVADILIERNMLTGPCTDDAGGYLPNGFLLDSHALYKLSLDRKDDNRPHFLPNTDNVLENLSLIILGMNTSTSIVGANREDTCNYIRGKVKESRTKTKEDEDKLIESQRKTGRKIKRKWVQSTLYSSSCGAFNSKRKGTSKHRDENCREEFGTSFNFFNYCHSILEAQRGYCAISGIFLQTELSGPRSPFKLSVDAIKPRLGHVRGNIRIVCQFLNSVNHDNTKNYEDEDDRETSWTKESFEEYFQINGECV